MADLAVLVIAYLVCAELLKQLAVGKAGRRSRSVGKGSRSQHRAMGAWWHNVRQGKRLAHIAVPRP